MGDWYDFEIKIIDGVEVSGFCYQNADTGWQEVFVEMTAEQCEKANQIQQEYDAIRQKQRNLIQSWIKG